MTTDPKTVIAPAFAVESLEKLRTVLQAIELFRKESGILNDTVFSHCSDIENHVALAMLDISEIIKDWVIESYLDLRKGGER